MTEGQNGNRTTQALDMATPIPVVSVDSHVGPRLVEDLRQYCPKPYLARFDQHAAAHEAAKQAGASMLIANVARAKHTGHREQAQDNLCTAGHHDIHARTPGHGCRRHRRRSHLSWQYER